MRESATLLVPERQQQFDNFSHPDTNNLTLMHTQNTNNNIIPLLQYSDSIIPHFRIFRYQHVCTFAHSDTNTMALLHICTFRYQQFGTFAHSDTNTMALLHICTFRYQQFGTFAHSDTNTMALLHICTFRYQQFGTFAHSDTNNLALLQILFNCSKRDPRMKRYFLSFPEIQFITPSK